jgi:DNA sulfur modification protein DndD
MVMAKSAESLFQTYTAQRLQVENEKQEYLQLLDQKKKQEEVISLLQLQLQDALQYSVANKELYDNLKGGLNQESTIKNKIEQTKLQVETIHKKEGIFHDDLDEFVKEMELNVCLPKMTEAIKSEINLILKVKEQQQQQHNSNISPEQIEAISKTILQYLKENSLVLKDITTSDLVDYVIAASSNSNEKDQYDFLEFSEVKALENLLNVKINNIFPSLRQQQVELNVSLNQIPLLETQIENMRAQITGRDYALLKAFEDNESSIKKHEMSIADTKVEIAKIDKSLHHFDIQTSQDPDPKYEALGRLKGFFEDVANRLLKVKKQQIELKMKQDLNINLAAYRDVIDRVELSENLKDLTFKIYHKAGNELYLNQLNTASKQVVIQVLLKSLHEFGDYDPPVMIDTVMGVLDETSRATVLENYFPELSQQTILLSSDSEIRTGKDLEKIVPFISKTFTLQRDREKQITDIVPGYFGVNIND